MLRSLGTSLIAKSSPGGKLRESAERKVNATSIPGKGALGNISRLGLQDPLEAQGSVGSDKIIAQRPLVQGLVNTPTNIGPEQISTPEGSRFAPTWQPSPISPDNGGDGVGYQAPRQSQPSGNNNQALFQGGVSTPQPMRSAARRTSAPAPTQQGQVLGASTSAEPNVPTINLQSPGLRSTPSPAQNQKTGGRIIVDNILRSLKNFLGPKTRSGNIA